MRQRNASRLEFVPIENDAAARPSADAPVAQPASAEGTTKMRHKRMTVIVIFRCRLVVRNLAARMMKAKRVTKSRVRGAVWSSVRTLPQVMRRSGKVQYDANVPNSI